MYQNKIFIALGTNLGNWKNNFNQSFTQLDKLGDINQYSSIFLSKPYGYLEQNYFYNTAIELHTTLNPMQLFKKLQLIEKKIHKNKLFPNGPRRIDLDIIFFNKLLIKNNHLIVPHPRAHLRDFVLCPIEEMNPFFIHPKKKITIRELIKNLKEKYILKKIFSKRESVLIY